VAERADALLLALGKRLVRAFFVLHKTAGNYGAGHRALGPAVAELAETVREFERRREEAALEQHDDSLFVGELRVRPDAAGYEAFFATLRELRRLGIGSVTFTGQAGAAELEAWFLLLREIETAAPPDPCGALLARMAALGITGVEVERPAAGAGRPAPAIDPDARERARGIYAQTIDVVAEAMEHAKVGKALRLKRAKRVVQTMIDQLLAAEASLLGLTNLRSHDEYTYHHSVNVGILSIAIGQRVGFGKNRLVELGTAAIFHDIGKFCVPLAVLNKPTAFDEQEWAVMRRHPVLGVRELLKLKGLDALTAHVMQGAFEHHLNLDGSGYPQVDYPQGMSLGGRIIAIADCYDALTSSRVYQRTATTPDAALRHIMQKAGSLYDPILAKLFANALGVYPAGTLCQLSSGELAVVLQGNPDPELSDRPRVKVIAARTGAPLDGPLLDLADPAAGRAVARTLDARQHGIDVAQYFL
jgi:HD-GYP domain-containing protein (c-di-GMP phosphodiesterase class II)